MKNTRNKATAALTIYGVDPFSTQTKLKQLAPALETLNLIVKTENGNIFSVLKSV